MSNLLTVIQGIAVNAVQSTIPVQYCYGTVTKESPLKIRLNDGTIEITGESILLTEPVVEKKITIQKHNHSWGNDLLKHAHSYVNAAGVTTPTSTPINIETQTSITSANVDDKVISGVCTEHGTDLPTDSNSDRIVITINRKLEKDDKVLMMRVSAGQKFIVLSRIFDHE
jgi:hypothetical protein